MRAKEFRLDASRLELPDDLVAVCIPYWFRDSLLDATERFLWSRVWKSGNEDHELTESEISRIEYAIYRLSTDSFCWEDFMPPITIEVNPIITINPPSSGGDGCCGTSPQPWEPVPWPPGTPNYPIPPYNPPIPNVPPVMPPDTDPSEWDVLRCKAANYAWDQIRLWLVAISNIPANLLAIGSILALIWALAPLGLLAIIGVGVLELASVIWSWYTLSEGIDEIAEYAVSWWDEHHEDIVCQFYDMTDNQVTRTAIVSGFLEDLAVWAEGRPWWVDSLAGMLQSVGNGLMPLQIFTAPWELVHPTGYVGSITCPCSPAEDEEWQEHATYVWTPLTNAMLESMSITVDSPGQQNIKSISLQDTGVITWSYTDALSGDWVFELLTASVLATVPGSVRLAGVAWDIYESSPLFSAGGSPYWYQYMNGGGNFDCTATDVYPKKLWLGCNNPEDTDVNLILQGIATYYDLITLGAMDTDISSNAEIQSNASHARSGRCRVRFLVKVED